MLKILSPSAAVMNSEVYASIGTKDFHFDKTDTFGAKSVGIQCNLQS